MNLKPNNENRNFIANKKLRNIISLLTIILFSFLLMNQGIQTCDDFVFSLHYKSKEPISNIWQIFDSQITHYYEANGRFLIHCIVQLFATFSKGLPYIWIMNALIFTLLLMGIHKTVTREVSIPFHTTASIYIAFIIFFLPGLGATYLGNIAFSVNYLWTSCVFVWYLYAYEKAKNTNGTILSNTLLLFLSIAAGSLQEAFSIGLAGALCINWLMYRKHISKAQLWMIIGFCVGTLILCLAPGNFSRAEVVSSPDIVRRIKNILIILSEACIIPITLCLLTVCYYKSKENALKMIKNNRIPLIASFIFFSFSCIFFIGPHQLTAIGLCCIIVILRILNTVSQKKLRVCSLICTCLAAVFFCMAYHNRHIVKTAHDEMCNVQGDYIMSAAYDKLMYSKPSYLMRRTSSVCHHEAFEPEIFSKWAGIEPVLTLRLPQTKEYIVNACNEKNKTGENVYKTPSDVFWIIRASVDSENQNDSIEVTYRQSAPFIKQLLGLKPSYVKILQEINKLPHFTSHGYVYSIVMSNEYAPVVSIKF